MLGVGVGLCNLAVAVIDQNGFVVLRAVDDALLERGVDLTGGHRGSRCAHGVDHGNRRRTVHGADLQTLEVRRRCRRAVLGGVDRTCAGIEPADGDKAILAGRLEDLLDSLGIVHYVEVMLGRLEYVRDREDGIRLVELLKCARRYLCNIEYACLDQLDHGAVVAELTIRVNIEGIIGFLLHLIAHIAQTDVNRMPVTVTVCNQQTLWVLTAAAAGRRKQCRTRKHAGKDFFHAFHLGNSLRFYSVFLIKARSFPAPITAKHSLLSVFYLLRIRRQTGRTCTSSRFVIT